jgi:hypothetical protein
MEHFASTQIKNLGINLIRQGDLLYHEGPVLSHYVNADNSNEHYIYKWTDCNNSINRWMVFRVSLDELKFFFEGKRTLLELINQNPFVYFIDLNNNLEKENLVICTINQIPSDYLPSENSFFKEKQYEKYAIELKNSLLKQGNTSVTEYALFEKIMQEVQNIKTSQQNQSTLISLLFNRLNLPH